MNKIISWALYFTAMFAPLLIWGWEAESQLPQVTVVGAVTPGHCTGFSSTLQLQDTGSFCGAAGQFQTGGFNNITLSGAGTGNAPIVIAAGGDTNVGLNLTTKGNSGYGFFGNNFGDTLFQINGSTTAVNFLTVTPANTGAGPQLGATGTDTNIPLTLSAKGAANVVLAGTPGNSATLEINNANNNAAATLLTGATGGHLAMGQIGGGTPSLTAGCNGAGSSVTGNDTNGVVVGQTAAATTCTLTFGTAYGSAPRCVTSGAGTPITSTVTATGTLVVNFASTANFNWYYICLGT